MFANSILLVAAATSVAALAVRRASPPAGWWTDGLEPYNTYHARYMALSCLTQHNTSFFDACCHPLLKNEPLSSRPDECDPAKSDTDCDGDNDDDDDDNSEENDQCDSEDDGDNTSSAPTTTAQPKATSSAPSPPKNVAPKPTTSSQAPPPPPPTSTSSSTSQAPKSSAPANPPSNILASGSGGIATYFYQNGVKGSCGTAHDDTDKVVALDSRIYNTIGDCGTSSLCGKTIHITDQKTGKSVDATVADCCPTCISKTSIDLSLGAFQALAPLGDGVFDVTWSITD